MFFTKYCRTFADRMKINYFEIAEKYGHPKYDKTFKTEYKFVHRRISEKIVLFEAKIDKWASHWETEREAALAVDKYRIKKGKNPINILKPIKN